MYVYSLCVIAMEREGGGGNIRGGWVTCVEGTPCLLNVFQSELMSPTRCERCARCMCRVCTYKPAPLVVLLATVVTHSEPVLPGEVSYMYMYVQSTAHVLIANESNLTLNCFYLLDYTCTSNQKHSLWESWWHIGFEGNSDVKSKETRSYQKGKCNCLYLAHKEHMPYKCVIMHFPL